MTMRKHVAPVLLAVALAGSALLTAVQFAAPAGAAFPGRPGLIAISVTTVNREGDRVSSIYTIRPDGTGLRRLTIHGGGGAASPTWGPRGGRILYTAWSGIWMMYADGSHKTRLVRRGSDPTWSPVGGRFAFTARGQLAGTRQFSQLFVYSFATGEAVQVTKFTHPPVHYYIHKDVFTPGWSPSGGRIAFIRATGDKCDLWSVHPDGGGVLRATREYRVGSPDWAPSGERLVTIDLAGRNPSVCSPHKWHDAVLTIRRSDGTPTTTIPTPGAFDSAWSPGGGSIVWSKGLGHGPDLWFVHPDGTGTRHIHIPIRRAAVTYVDWQPLPAHN